LASQELLAYQTFIAECHQTTKTTGEEPPCPPELHEILERLHSLRCALAYVDERVLEMEVYNERNANCFLAADAWHDAFEKNGADMGNLINRLSDTISKLSRLPDFPPEMQRELEDKIQELRRSQLYDTQTYGSGKTLKGTLLLKYLNLVHIVKGLGWMALAKVSLSKQGYTKYEHSEARTEARNIENNIPKLQKELNKKSR